MKGMLDFLEKAGLVKRDAPQEQSQATVPTADHESAPPAASQSVASVDTTARIPDITATALDLDGIYATAGLTPAQYPAERLLRLVDGLSAMDSATRLMAIQAMDAADESWTISDPLQDASAKVTALATYQEDIRLKLAQLELQTQNHLEIARTRQEQVVGEIRKQISELEALVARELSRGEQVTSELQSNLELARQQTANLLQAATQVSQRLQSLGTQLGNATPVQQET